MISLEDLNYKYPVELIAQQPQRPSRVMMVENCHKAEYFCSEINIQKLLSYFKEGDVLLINDTKVNKRRIYSECGLEILFIEALKGDADLDELSGDLEWTCLFPAKKKSLNDLIKLPDGIEMHLLKKGIPQTVKLSQKLTDEYFNKWGDFALPPYIQKARGERKNKPQDKSWYQTDWAEKPGSTAAPTASLHFTKVDLENLKDRGVKVESLSLHVGLGTFLPIREGGLNEHVMHSEYVEISKKLIQTIRIAKKQKKLVWAMGTTSARAIESWAKGLLFEQESGDFKGDTDLFIYPGFSFEVVDVLMTNFHQPKSSLLSLVSAFSGLEVMKSVYEEAINKRFKLFSYGDLSVWIRRGARI